MRFVLSPKATIGATVRRDIMKNFVVLYTKHKQRKSKIWQDGFATSNPTNNKVSLYDERHEFLDSNFLSKRVQLEVGTEFETDRYLVTVEEVCPAVQV